jgi:hypothetical protein
MSSIEHKLLSDPAVSNRLKEQIIDTKDLALVDTINETEALLFVLKQRFHNQNKDFTSANS